MGSETAVRWLSDCFFKAYSVCIQTTLRYNSICIGNTEVLSKNATIIHSTFSQFVCKDVVEAK